MKNYFSQEDFILSITKKKFTNPTKLGLIKIFFNPQTAHRRHTSRAILKSSF